MNDKIEIAVPEGKVAKQAVHGNSIIITFEDKDTSVVVNNKSFGNIISERSFGSLAGKAFCLTASLNWEIRRDESGILCLIPTKQR
jgi:hypothetical protein